MARENDTRDITKLILAARDKARRETSDEPEPDLIRKIDWPIDCIVGPGLEGALACESKVGYVNGSKGWLVYRGYDIFDLCAHSNFEEVSFLLLRGKLPSAAELSAFKAKLASYRFLPKTMRQLMSFPVEDLNTMAALRLGTLFMRQKQTYLDTDVARPDVTEAIHADEDSHAMETQRKGEEHAAFEFRRKLHRKPKAVGPGLRGSEGYESCYHLIAGVPTITAAIARLRSGALPIEPDPELSHAANLLYMMSGERPTPEETRVMDVALILHADHGMNASTFAAMVVASTLSDVYFSIGAGIAALNGPLHGGANEQVLRVLRDEIRTPGNVSKWFAKARTEKRKIMGFGHRVYKAYDPRARVLAPLADHLVKQSDDREMKRMLQVATRLEKQVVATLGKQKGIFPNVDYYSGIVYSCLGVPHDLFTPLFAVARVSGWSARVLEYLQNNRIFRPRATYTGEFGKSYVPLDDRD